jgi:hypothetical protein
MTPTRFFTLLGQLTLAGGILLLGHYGFGWLAALLALVSPAWYWWQQGRTPTALAAAVSLALTGLSIVALISLDRPPYGQSVFPVVTQVALAVGYAIWLMAWERFHARPGLALGIAGLNQLLAVSAIFLATAFWHWPELVTVSFVFGVSFANARWYLGLQGERAAHILAVTWGLVVAQICWVLAAWQVHYIIGGGYLVIPQAAHADKRLSRRLLIEYVAITGVLLAIVVAGTRWSGTV